MREILFRGQITATKEWILGALVIDWNGNPHIIKENTYGTNIATCDDCGCIEHDSYEVIPETVGQFTGKKSKDKQKLFDGDIFEAGDGKVPTLIFWNEINVTWYVRNLRRNEDSAMGRFFDRFIGNKIGNCWDNPELLGGDTQ